MAWPSEGRNSVEPSGPPLFLPPPLLPPRVRRAPRHDAADRIGAAGRREGHDQAHVAGGIDDGLGARPRWAKRRRERRGPDELQAMAGVDHTGPRSFGAMSPAVIARASAQ